MPAFACVWRNNHQAFLKNQDQKRRISFMKSTSMAANLVRRFFSRSYFSQMAFGRKTNSTFLWV